MVCVFSPSCYCSLFLALLSDVFMLFVYTGLFLTTSVLIILLLLTAYGSGLGSGYGDGYGGGAMKGSAYTAKAPGPYGGMKLQHYIAFRSVDCY